MISMLLKNAIAGLKTTGIYPPNRNTIKLPGEAEALPFLANKCGIP